MGCSSSSSSVVPLGEPTSNNGPGIKVLVTPSDAEKIIPINGATPRGKKILTTIPSTPPPPPRPNKGHSNLEKHSKKVDETKGTNRRIPPTPPQPPLAFDIPLDEESIIKKHPPKKIKKLQQMENFNKPLTHEELNNKLKEAEMRRREFLNQRIQSAQIKNNQYRQLVHVDAISQKGNRCVSIPDLENYFKLVYE